MAESGIAGVGLGRVATVTIGPLVGSVVQYSKDVCYDVTRELNLCEAGDHYYGQLVAELCVKNKIDIEDEPLSVEETQLCLRHGVENPRNSGNQELLNRCFSYVKNIAAMRKILVSRLLLVVCGNTQQGKSLFCSRVFGMKTNPGSLGSNETLSVQPHVLKTHRNPIFVADMPGLTGVHQERTQLTQLFTSFANVMIIIHKMSRDNSAISVAQKILTNTSSYSAVVMILTGFDDLVRQLVGDLTRASLGSKSPGDILEEASSLALVSALYYRSTLISRVPEIDVCLIAGLGWENVHRNVLSPFDRSETTTTTTSVAEQYSQRFAFGVRGLRCLFGNLILPLVVSANDLPLYEIDFPPVEPNLL